MSIKEMKYEDEKMSLIEEKMRIIVRNELTMGRTDNDLEEYTSEEIELFLKENEDDLKLAALTMFNSYKCDGELEELEEEAPMDWFREYLEYFVDTRFWEERKKSWKK